MDPFVVLCRATARAQEENDLPDFLAEQLFLIAARPEDFREEADAIADLACQVEQYDTYGQTGYLGMGVNNVILEGAIKRILEKHSPS